MGGVLEEREVPLSKVGEIPWYKVFTSGKYKAGEEYLLRMSASGTGEKVSLATMPGQYVGEESLEGNAAIVFAYGKPTFNNAARILIPVFLLGFWLALAWAFYRDGDARGTVGACFQRNAGVIGRMAAFVLMTAMLAWNFSFNSLDGANTTFAGFQLDSETLVTGTLTAEETERPFSRSGALGLGLRRYETALGPYKGYELAPVTDGSWNLGYSRTEPVIHLGFCEYVSECLARADKVRFAGGEEISIDGYKVERPYINVRLDAEGALDPTRYGSLKDIRFVGDDGFVSVGAQLTSYKSQFGLQGRAYRLLARVMGLKKDYSVLNALNALLTAAVLAALVMLLAKKYGRLFALVSYAVFLLSPWIVNFGNNLYWVEFTWFLPMLAGLVLTMRVDSRRCRVACYAAAFAAILLKCLCGYEYVSSVMMGLIAFPAVEFISSAASRDEGRARKLLSSTFALGMAALSGFVLAILIHGFVLGDGDLAEGVRWILADKAVSRTSGGDLNLYWDDPTLTNAISASHWETICKYFHFNTEVVAGVTGNLFPALCIVPLILFAIDFARGRLDARVAAMYAIFFFVPVSWYFLAKPHSFIHTHMNFVLWYMGFVQTCFYVIARRIMGFVRRMGEPSY